MRSDNSAGWRLAAGQTLASALGFRLELPSTIGSGKLPLKNG
jgi:hypothetical protein